MISIMVMIMTAVVRPGAALFSVGSWPWIIMIMTMMMIIIMIRMMMIYYFFILWAQGLWGPWGPYIDSLIP